MGNSWKPRFHELEHESMMRLLETHSHTSERQGNEAGKVRKKNERKAYSLEGQEEIVNGKLSPCHQRRGVEEDAWKSEK